MTSEIRLGAETFLTQLTLVGFDASVPAHVMLPRRLGTETLTTQVTLEWVDVRVRLLVLQWKIVHFYNHTLKRHVYMLRNEP